MDRAGDEDHRHEVNACQSADPGGGARVRSVSGEAMQELQLVWDTKCEVSESVVFDERRRRILFCDQTGARIYALGLDDDSRRSWSVPGPLGSFGLCRSGRLIVALQRRIVML